MIQTSRQTASMFRYRRLPAALILCAFFGVGGFVVLSRAHAARAAGAGEKAHWSLEQLEVAIASADDPQVWRFYGDRLVEQKHFRHAVSAYKKALDGDPGNADVRFRCGLALASCGADDELYGYLKDLVLSDPRMAENVFGSPECGEALADARFKSLAREAHLQAMD